MFRNMLIAPYRLVKEYQYAFSETLVIETNIFWREARIREQANEYQIS